MPKFVLLDHSLKDLGGHHFEYDVHILRRAEAAGFAPVLATYWGFEERHRLPAHWQVFPLFRYSSYLKYSVTVDASHPPLNPFLPPLQPTPDVASWGTRLGPARLWQRLCSWRDRLRQRKRLNYFARSCARLFRQNGLTAGDHVFAPTLSEFDLVGLVRFLTSCPAARQVDWHLQFHFPFLAGREPDYARQADRIEAMREHFAGLLSTVADYRLRFYSTTAQVAAQYNRLGVAEFELLPYPVNPSFRPAAEQRVEQRPLRVVCAGGMREEKGQHQLEHIVQELWPDCLAPGRLQLLVQAGPDGRLPEAPAAPASGPPWGEGESPSAAASRTSPILRVPHPLPLDEYADLVRTADIGLFLYDSERYYTRCSGILVEMLCSGVPVIVPAGCWLAEELADSIYRHLDQLAQSLPTLAVLAGRDVPRAGHGGLTEADATEGTALTFARGPAGLLTEVGVPDRATEALISFRWVRPQEAGSYLRVECEQLDRRGQSLERGVAIVGQRASHAAVPALFHLRAPVDRLRIRWENAYQDAPVAIRDLNLRLLSAASLPGRSCPAGSVGLIAADAFQIPELLRDMTAHYAHYRQTARQFSLGYGRLHDPRQALEQLLAGAVRSAAA